MELDWITITAQILNFLVLVWLLKRFLYGPVIRAIRGREERIAKTTREADEKRRQAEEEAAEYRRKIAAIEGERETLLARAREEAAELRHRLEAEARQAVQDEREEWMRRLGEDRERFLRDLETRTAEFILEAARQALRQVADSDLEAQLTARFLRKLDDLDEDAQATLRDAVRSADQPVRIETGFEFTAAARTRITKAVEDRLAIDRGVEYAVDPSLVLGVRLECGPAAVEWSVRSYLDAVGQEAARLLDQHPSLHRQDAA